MNTVTARRTSYVETFRNTILTEKHGKIICEETYKNGNIETQEFKLPKAVHNGYEPSRMRFVYYGGKLDSHKITKQCLNSDYDNLPKEQIVVHLKSFDDFENLYCIWTSMDGNMYRLTDLNPLPATFRFDLWGTRFDLDKCKKALKKHKSVSSVHLHDNCAANWSISGRQSLVFDWKANATQTLERNKIDCYLRDNFIARLLGLDEFRLPERNEEENDDYDYYE